jgi:transcriptional regulator with XRE-family HTH domain
VRAKVKLAAAGEVPDGAQIRKLRLAAGWTQAEAAEQVRVARRTLQDWESGIAAMPAGLWELMRIKAARLIDVI